MTVSASQPPYRTMHQHVLDVLGAEIVSGTPPAGATLEPEPILCQRLGVSRGAIREAVKALAAKGMVELRPRTGTRVLPRANWNLLDRQVLSWLQQSDPDALIVHLTEVRRLIEPGAAELAAQRSTEEEAQELVRTAGAMESAYHSGKTETALFTAADVAFHHVLLRMTHNPLLTALNSSLEIALRASFATTSTAPGAIPTTVRLHQQLAQSILRREPADARALMGTLIDTSAENFAAVRAKVVIRHSEPS